LPVTLGFRCPAELEQKVGSKRLSRAQRRLDSHFRCRSGVGGREGQPEGRCFQHARSNGGAGQNGVDGGKVGGCQSPQRLHGWRHDVGGDQAIQYADECGQRGGIRDPGHGRRHTALTSGGVILPGDAAPQNLGSLRPFGHQRLDPLQAAFGEAVQHANDIEPSRDQTGDQRPDRRRLTEERQGAGVVLPQAVACKGLGLAGSDSAQRGSLGFPVRGGGAMDQAIAEPAEVLDGHSRRHGRFLDQRGPGEPGRAAF